MSAPLIKRQLMEPLQLIPRIPILDGRYRERAKPMAIFTIEQKGRFDQREVFSAGLEARLYGRQGCPPLQPVNTAFAKARRLVILRA